MENSESIFPGRQSTSSFLSVLIKDEADSSKGSE
jgi:hypothetical protein